MRPRHRSDRASAGHLHVVPDLRLEDLQPRGGAPAALPPEVIRGTDCRCAHPRRAHEHFRRGSDCALCDCVRYSTCSFAMRA